MCITGLLFKRKIKNFSCKFAVIQFFLLVEHFFESTNDLQFTRETSSQLCKKLIVQALDLCVVKNNFQNDTAKTQFFVLRKKMVELKECLNTQKKNKIQHKQHLKKQ